MEKNTKTATASSPPSFMTEGKVDDAKAKATRQVSKEAEAQNQDEFEKRLATIEKATARLKEMSGYLGLIDKAVSGSLPEFIAKHPMGQLLDTFKDLKDQVEEFESQFKLVKGRVDMAREVSLPARLDAEETRTFTAESGKRITRTIRLFASIITPKADEAYKWLRENGYESLIKETVNSSSLSAAAKEVLANGKEMPEEFFRVHTKDGVSITDTGKGKK